MQTAKHECYYHNNLRLLVGARLSIYDSTQFAMAMNIPFAQLLLHD